MRAHLVQFDIAWEDKQANYARVESMLDAAGVGEGDLVLLPELFDTGFSFRIERTNDGDGATDAFLSALARRLRVTLQGARTVVGPDGRGRNRASVYAPDGRRICEYDKIHPFSFGREPERFTGGDAVTAYQWAAGDRSLRVCPAVCYDLRFPEMFREGLRLGAEVFALGANWPSPRAAHWRALLIARAIENQAFVLGVNRCGADPHLAYSGGSIAIDPKGEVLAEAADEERVLSCDIDPAAVASWRETFPAWRDRRLP